MNTVNIATFILDDDEDLLAMIRQVIEKSGINNYQLFTHEDAFLSGLDNEIHVCVVDHFLIRKTGLEIVDAIKNKNAGSFIIAYTGVKDPKVIIKYLNLGIDKFVDKDEPNHLDQLTRYLIEGSAVAKRRMDFAEFILREKEKIR